MGYLVSTFSYAASEQTPKWKGTISKEGDVVVVKNPREPIYKSPILSLKEELTIGGSAANGESALSRPMDIACDNEGNIFVLERSESCIKVFDNSGKYLRKIGRPGQGPGELGFPISLSVFPARNEIFICDVGNSRLSVFSLEGNSLSQHQISRMAPQAKIDSSGAVYIIHTEFKPASPENVLVKLAPAGTTMVAELARHNADQTTNPFKPRDDLIVDCLDRLICGDERMCEVRYFSPDAKLIRRVLREFEPVRVTKEDIDEFLTRPTPPGINPTYDFSTPHSAYGGFFADDQGNLFVRTWERTPDRSQDIHDIFDAEGRYIGRVALSRQTDLVNPKPRFIRAGKLYSIEPDAEGYEVVKRYSVS